jgi:hypothetical protein
MRKINGFFIGVSYEILIVSDEIHISKSLFYVKISSFKKMFDGKKS